MNDFKNIFLVLLLFFCLFLIWKQYTLQNNDIFDYVKNTLNHDLNLKTDLGNSKLIEKFDTPLTKNELNEYSKTNYELMQPENPKNSVQDRNNLVLPKNYSQNVVNISTDYLLRTFMKKLKSISKSKEKIFSNFSFLMCLSIFYIASKNQANTEFKKIFNNNHPNDSLLFLQNLNVNFTKYNIKSITYLLLNKKQIELSEAFLNSTKFNPHINILQAKTYKTDLSTKVNEIIRLNNFTLNSPNYIKVDESKPVTIINIFKVNLNWKNGFNAKLNKKEKFYSSKNIKKITFMNSVSKNMYYENHKMQIISLECNSLFMLIIILRKNHKTKFLHPEKIKYFYDKSSEKTINISLPKINITSVIDLSKTMKKLGYVYMFDKDSSVINENFRFGNFYQLCELNISEGSHYKNNKKKSDIYFIANHPFTGYLIFKPSFEILSVFEIK